MNTTVEVKIRKVFPVSETSRLRAVADALLNKEFVIHDIKIFEYENGTSVFMPSVKGGDGQYHDIAHAVTSEARRDLIRLTLEAYKAKINQN